MLKVLIENIKTDPCLLEHVAHQCELKEIVIDAAGRVDRDCHT